LASGENLKSLIATLKIIES